MPYQTITTQEKKTQTNKQEMKQKHKYNATKHVSSL